MPDHAVIYVPADVHDPTKFAAIAAPCLEHVEACGYVFAGVVRTWPDVRDLIEQGQAHVVVVADRGHLPHDRQPRIESVTDPVRTAAAEHCVVPAEVTAPRIRRPRRIR